MNNTAEDLDKTLAAIDAEIGIEARDDDTPKPWAGVPIPPGYLLTANGVAIDNDDAEALAFRPCWVSAVSRDTKGANWGRLVHWIDLDGREHAEAVPAELFHAQGNELAQRLASRGLPIAPGREKKLTRYLTAFQPKARMISATATGWHGEAFILPQHTIHQPEGEHIVLQVVGGASDEAIGTAGSFNAWSDLVAGVPVVVRFLICAALAAPLRYLLNVEAGGFHLCGATSKGKSTALQAAASVWGNGVDPGIAGGSVAYIQRWNATANALEAMAAGFNDLPLIVDEIGEGDGKDFGRTVYRIMSGSGRSRARRDGSLAQRRAWRVLLISAGELPVDQYISEGGGKSRGGQLVRLVDLPIEAVFPDATSADRIKHGSAEHYGHAGPAFVEWLAGHIDEAGTEWQRFDLERVGQAVTTEAGRARKRFALVAFAGQLAARLGILPWSESDTLEAARFAYDLWQRQSKATDEGQRGIENVRAFIEANAARFEVRDDQPPRDRAGWRRGDLWHFTREAFREACNGVNEQATKLALKAAGLLRYSHGLQAQLRVGGSKVKTVCVREEILSYVFSAGSSGSGGSNAEETRPESRTHQGNPTGSSGSTGSGSPQPGPSGPTLKNVMGPAESPAITGLDPADPADPLQNDELEQEQEPDVGRVEL